MTEGTRYTVYVPLTAQSNRSIHQTYAQSSEGSLLFMVTLACNVDIKNLDAVYLWKNMQSLARSTITALDLGSPTRLKTSTLL